MPRREVVAAKVLDRHHGVPRPQDEEFQAKVVLLTSSFLDPPEGLLRLLFLHVRGNPSPGAASPTDCWN